MWSDAHSYLLKFLSSSNGTFVHISIWTLYQLAKQAQCAALIKSSSTLVEGIKSASTGSDSEICTRPTFS